MTGDVLALDARQVRLLVAGVEQEVPVDQLLKIDWDQPEIPRTGAATLLMSDGSLFKGTGLVCDGLQTQWNSAAFSRVSVPFAQLKAVLVSPLEVKFTDQWLSLLQKESADDMLVIRKGDVLDFLPGVITEYNEQEVHFLYQGNEIPVKWDKIFGMIHPRKVSVPAGVLCHVETAAGDKVAVQKVTLAGQQLKLEQGKNVSLDLPLESAQSLDFSLGRIVYLSDLNPEGAEHTPYFDTIWVFQRDKTNINGPLRLGGERYAKGLWIHSKTRLTYRLAGEYSRFQSLVGIDDAVAENGLGHVQLQILADDKVIFEKEVAAFDEPLPLDLDLRGVRFLQVIVDFGKGLDIGDHLVLGNARLIK